MQRWIDDGTRVVGVESLQKVHRALDVDEQGRDGLALILKDATRVVGLDTGGRGCGDSVQRTAAVAAKPFFGRIGRTTASAAHT
jgi:hypothetical protein